MAGFLDTRSLSKIRTDDPKLGIGFQVLKIPATSGAEVINDDDLVTAMKKKFGKVRAYEATTSGNQNSHEVDPKLKNRGRIASLIRPSLYRLSRVCNEKTPLSVPPR